VVCTHRKKACWLYGSPCQDAEVGKEHCQKKSQKKREEVVFTHCKKACLLYDSPCQDAEKGKEHCKKIMKNRLKFKPGKDRQEYL
jgi:hypothetical protein